jgi:GntR family transcriptional regulator
MGRSSLTLKFGPVSAAAPGSLYEQIVANVRREVTAGRLAPHEPLPSVRALAAGLMVSVITVKRAYEELQREGIIYGSAGLGTFVSEAGAEQTERINRADTDAAIELAIDNARAEKIDDDELLARMQAALARRREE